MQRKLQRGVELFEEVEMFYILLVLVVAPFTAYGYSALALLTF